MLDFLSTPDGPPPACRDARSRLPVVTVADPGEQCAVCQEDLPMRCDAV